MIYRSTVVNRYKYETRKYICNDSQTSNMNPKNRKLSLIILFVWFCTPGYVDAQSFTWDSTNVQVKTSMTPSILIEGQDSIILTSTVNVAGTNFTMDMAVFEIKNLGSDYKSFCPIDILNCVGYEVGNCYCYFTEVKNVVKVVFNTTARAHFSEAILQGTIYNSENKIRSSELILPYIHDLSHPGIQVYINDRIEELVNCNKTINQTTAIIVVEKAKNELQYLFSLQDNKTSLYLRNATNFLFHVVEIKEETVFRITYQVSENPKIRTSFECTVRSLPQQKDSADDIILILALFLSCAILLLITLMIYILLMKKRCHRNMLIQDKKNSSDECEELFLLEAKEFLVTTTKDNIERESMEIFDLDKARPFSKLDTGSMLRSTTNTSISPVMSLPSVVLNLIKDNEGKEDTEEMKAGLLETSDVGLESLLKSFIDKNYILKILMSCQYGLMTTVTVESVSNRRPEKWPGTNVPYPYFQKDSYNGESSSRVGIGRIVSVRFTEEKNKQTLLTKHDFESHNGNKITKWVEIDIYTSRHVVFDDQEAKDATVSLMLDIPEIPGVRLKGKRVSMSNIRENWILLTCISYENDIYNILHQRVKSYNYTWLVINERYKLFNSINTKGYFLSVSESTIKKANFTELFHFFMKDRHFKKDSYALNTYFQRENIAIFVERKRESLICTLSKDEGKKMQIGFENDKWILGSLPLVIKNLNTV